MESWKKQKISKMTEKKNSQVKSKKKMVGKANDCFWVKRWTEVIDFKRSVEMIK